MDAVFCKRSTLILPQYAPLEMVEIYFTSTNVKPVPQFCVSATSTVGEMKFLIEEDCDVSYDDRIILRDLKNHRHISNDETIRSLIPRYNSKTHKWYLNLRLSIEGHH